MCARQVGKAAEQPGDGDIALESVQLVRFVGQPEPEAYGSLAGEQLAADGHRPLQQRQPVDPLHAACLLPDLVLVQPVVRAWHHHREQHSWRGDRMAHPPEDWARDGPLVAGL